jgi:hypothetical protein
LEQNPTMTSGSSTQPILSSKQSDDSHQTSIDTDTRSDERKNYQHGDRSSGHYRSDHQHDRSHHIRRSSRSSRDHIDR